MKTPQLTRASFIPPANTPPLVHLTNELKGTGTLVLSCDGNPVEILYTLSIGILSGIKIGGPAFNPLLLPKPKCKYRMLVLVNRVFPIYENSPVEYNSFNWGGTLGTSLAYSSTAGGELIASGPLVAVTAFPTAVSTESIPDSLVEAWNKVLSFAATQGDPNHLVRKLLRVHPTHLGTKQYRLEADRHIDKIKVNLDLYKRSVREQAERYRDARRKARAWTTARPANIPAGLARAKEEGIILSFQRVMGCMQLVFPSRKMALPACTHGRRSGKKAYPGGIYEFPEMLMLVRSTGCDCLMMTLDGNRYPHPHAGIYGATQAPCWDEQAAFDATPDDAFSQLSNAEKANYLWYSDPVNYCRYIVGYLNSRWESSSYAPLNSYGKLLEETEPAPEIAVQEREGHRRDLRTVLATEFDCDICGDEMCICICEACANSRATYLNGLDSVEEENDE